MKNVVNKYDTFNHAKYRIRYHIIFSTKYRKSCLQGMENEIYETFNNIAKRCQFQIVTMGIDNDHIHFIIKASPSIAISSIVRRLKQISTRELWKKYSSHFSHFYWKKRIIWTNGYFCATIGQVAEEKVLNYVNNQG